MKKLLVLCGAVLLAGAVWAAQFPDIKIDEVQSAITAKKVTLLDANGTDSWKEGHIPGAIDFSANAEKLEKAKLPERAGFAVDALAREQATSLREMAESIERHIIEGNNNDRAKLPRLEDLERRLTVLEEKLFAVLMAATPDEDLVKVRAEADRDIAPYRRNMTASQIEQLHKQYVHKRLLERCGVPRLSLFYMQ